MHQLTFKKESNKEDIKSLKSSRISISLTKSHKKTSTDTKNKQRKCRGHIDKF